MFMRKLFGIFVLVGFVQSLSIVEDIKLVDHVGEEHMNTVFERRLNRRLFEAEDAKYNLTIKTRTLLSKQTETDEITFEEVSCVDLQTMGQYSALSEDLEITLLEKEGPSSKTGYTSNTLMSRDFGCVVTFMQVPGGLYLQGVYLHPDSGHIEFQVMDCPDGTDGKSSTCISVEEKPDEKYKCDLVEEDVEKRELNTVKAALPFKLERWNDCFNDMREIHELSIGIAVGSQLVKTLGGSKKVLPYIEAIVSEANVLYVQQMNIKLLVTSVKIVDPSAAGSVEWDNPSCKDTIFDQLRNFYKADKEDLGFWKLLDDCYEAGAIGAAVKSSICGSAGAGVTWFSKNGGTWKIFSHEVGHIFGSSHSFEEGVGQTGGIMDYGDGLYKKEFQYNTEYRKEEVCEYVNKKLDCEHWRILTPEIVEELGTCGNNKLDDGEECECPKGKTTCDCCENCKLKPTVECSPFGNECCTDKCTYRPTKQICSHSDGPGYCRNGYCAPSECVFLGQGNYCGVQNDDSPCRKRCESPTTGECLIVPAYFFNGRNMRNIRDGAFCQTNDIDYGQCFDGTCFEVTGKSVQDPTPFPSLPPNTEFPTSFPSLPPSTEFPTRFPTLPPSTEFPTKFPTLPPSTDFPTKFPSFPPSTDFPTSFPTTDFPTSFPTKFPSTTPTSKYPTEFPTTKEPTPFPTRPPTAFPTTRTPTAFPTKIPTLFPTSFPTDFPTPFPITPEPTTFPTTRNPTSFPTRPTTVFPTSFPTEFPTAFPTTRNPTTFPTKVPTVFPTSFPTRFPTQFPVTPEPTGFPVFVPTKFPTKREPTPFPTRNPTPFPTTRQPTPFPTTSEPTSFPTAFPISRETNNAGDGNRITDTKYPTFYPTEFPASNFVPSESENSKFCCEDLSLLLGGGSFSYNPSFADSFVCRGARWAGKGCEEHSFNEAKSICESVGARLCSAPELQLLKSDGLGCDFTNSFSWTTTNCVSYDNTGKLAVRSFSDEKADEAVCISDTDVVFQKVVCCADSC